MRAVCIQSFLCLIFLKSFSSRVILQEYEAYRSNLIKEESKHSLGGSLHLSHEEAKVNDILMKLKDEEMENSFYNPRGFNMSKHYFTYRNQIEGSKVYQIIKRMPKGAALHIHSTFMLDADYLLSLTYEDHLYVCLTNDDLQLRFSESPPQLPCTVEWALLSELRNASTDVETFDHNIKQYFTLYSENNENTDSDINSVWEKFNKVYRSIKSLILYRPIREKFIYESLKKFYDDNILYIEIRSGLHILYELDGTEHEGIYMAKLYKDITDRFKEEYPDFIGIKLILTRHRSANVDQLKNVLNSARQLKKELPDMFAGFDLVGQEDLGKPLKDFIPTLAEAKDDMNFYFHGGETNWYGTESDENLVDAILLGSKRIGHAYALLKHPTLMMSVIQNDIALEVNVISNSVLSLVSDVRNHPLAVYLALGLPVVLSSDDPGVWGADPLSHDFYVSFIGVASKHSDLRLLKKLILNSIQYSALDVAGKVKLLNVFNKRWTMFLKYVIETYSHCLMQSSR